MIEPLTKLPWRVSGSDDCCWIKGADDSYLQQGYDGEMDEDDAAYIVHAANNYPKAIEALEPFSDIADEGNEDQPDDTPCTIHAGRSICYGFTLGQFRALRRLFAILSQAEEPRP